MQLYEYKVVSAPTRGEKARGIRTAPDRFAQALSSLMNRMAQDGWEYLRSDTLPAEEREGLLRRITVYHNVLVFRRARGSAAVAAGTAPAALSPEVAARDAASASLGARPPLSVVAPSGAAPRVAPPDSDTGPQGAGPRIGPATKD